MVMKMKSISPEQQVAFRFYIITALNLVLQWMLCVSDDLAFESHPVILAQY